MLLKFEVSNYKVFADPMTFSMEPAQGQTGLEYSIYTETVNGKTYRSLPAAAVYGPNGAGKSTIVQALDVLKSIMLTESVPGWSEAMPNTVDISNIPNCNQSEAHPVSFHIEFLDQGMVFGFDLAIDAGRFGLNRFENTKFVFEKLTMNDELIYVRENNSLEFGLEYTLRRFAGSSQGDVSADIADIWKEVRGNLSENVLFLKSGYSLLFGDDIPNRIEDWLKRKLIILTREDLENAQYCIQDDEDQDSLSDFLTRAIHCLGIGSERMVIRENAVTGEFRLFSDVETGNKIHPIGAEQFESRGLQHILHWLIYILEALQQGGTLVMDEFDGCIHSSVMANILNIFHNDEINRHGAQLIFCTHNPAYLEPSLLRADEIHFVQKTGPMTSEHYTLAEFEKTGDPDADEYEKNYLMGKYGAIDDTDFSDLFQQVLSEF